MLYFKITEKTTKNCRNIIFYTGNFTPNAFDAFIGKELPVNRVLDPPLVSIDLASLRNQERRTGLAVLVVIDKALDIIRVTDPAAAQYFEDNMTSGERSAFFSINSSSGVFVRKP